jgi:maltose alpha-D-glucosyltransferase/alpha-amylase
LRALPRDDAAPLSPSLLRAEQSNTSVIYGDQYIFKLYRRLDEGINPDWEICRFLTERRRFEHIAPVAGALEFRPEHGEPMTLALLQYFIQSQGDGWTYTLDSLAMYFTEALALQPGVDEVAIPSGPVLASLGHEVPPLAEELIGFYLQAAQLLGQRTGEMHVALAQPTEIANFTPEPFTEFYRQGLYQGMLGHATMTMQLLRQRQRHLPEAPQDAAQQLLSHTTEVRRRFRALRDRKIAALRTRCHGDYHLGQVLYTGQDFIIIDFEGEPARTLTVRRMKRSPLRDVAGMLRSFHYAAYAALLDQVPGIRQQDFPVLEPLARFWYHWVSVAFLTAYFEATAEAGFLPASPDEQHVLLDAYLLEKALYEVGYELNNRPDWLIVPLQGCLQLLGVAV